MKNLHEQLWFLACECAVLSLEMPPNSSGELLAQTGRDVDGNRAVCSLEMPPGSSGALLAQTGRVLAGRCAICSREIQPVDSSELLARMGDSAAQKCAVCSSEVSPGQPQVRVSHEQMGGLAGKRAVSSFEMSPTS